MTTIKVGVDVPKDIGSYPETLASLRARKQRAFYRAIARNQRDDKMADEIQMQFGARKISAKNPGDNRRLIARFGQKVFRQRWSAIGTSRPPLAAVVNSIMGNLYALAPRWPGDKTRTARYRDSFQLYRRQSGEKQLSPTIYPIADTGWDTDTMFVITNLISYASSLESQEFTERGQGIMYHAAKMSAKRYPFVGVRFRYYQENRLPGGDYGRANADLRAIRYYSIPVIEVGRASLVRKPSRRPGVNARSSSKQIRSRAQRSAQRRVRRLRSR